MHLLATAVLIVGLVHPVTFAGAESELRTPAGEPLEQPVGVEPSGPLSLPEALALALLHSPDLAAFSWEVRVREARVLQAGKIPNPELDMRFYRLGAPRRSTPNDDERTRVVLSQVFELGGKRRRRVALAGVDRQLANWDYEARRIEVAAELARRFAAVLGAQRRVQTCKQLVAFLEQIRGKVATLIETGTLPSVEAFRSARQIGLAKIARERAASELSAARFSLAALWGGRSPKFTELVGDLEQTVPIPEIEVVIEMAQQSPVVARWDAELARGRAQLDLAKSGRVPDLNYGVGMRWETDFDQRDYLVDLEFDLPIFDRKQGDRQEARHRMAQAEVRRKAANATSSERIARAYYALTESRSRGWTFAQEIIPASRAAFEAYRKSFDLQAGNLDDLLESRRELARAEIGYTSALVDFHRALATLEGLIGRSLSGDDR